jgi:hypothetical protein
MLLNPAVSCQHGGFLTLTVQETNIIWRYQVQNHIFPTAADYTCLEPADSAVANMVLTSCNIHNLNDWHSIQAAVADKAHIYNLRYQ